MKQGKGNDLAMRNEIYEQRMSRFLNRIKKFQSEEVNKILQKSKDQIQFQSGKITNQSHEKEQQYFGKKQKAFEVQMKIKKSRKINEARLSKMKMRFEMIQKVQNQIKTKLTQKANGKDYRDLLEKLILQGMIKLLQENVEVRCLARDVALVKEIMPICESKFGQICQVKTKLKLSPQNLPASDIGGIILTSFNGKIVCSNTLKARLDYAVQQALPDVRKNLFPASTQLSSSSNQGSATANSHSLI